MAADKIDAIVAQLVWCVKHVSGYISDGSTSKAYTGKLIRINATSRGLRLTVQQANGKTANINWRMTQDEATVIQQWVYDELGIQAKYIDESGSIAISLTQAKYETLYPCNVMAQHDREYTVHRQNA